MIRNWKEVIPIIENNRDWKGAINLLQNSDDIDLDLYLRVMFLLAFYLAEGQYSTEEYDCISSNLKVIYNEAKSKFLDNSQFLFFMAIIINIGEWYFGIDDIEFANQMLKNASEIETDNVLYKWGYYTCIDQRLEINTELKFKLSEQLLLNDISNINLLKQKGLLGEYILGRLETIYEDLKSR